MSEITNAMHLAISLLAIWFLYFVCWREHRMDTFRQNLFALRDELFDFAQSGGIAFDDPAYTTLRNVANGMIRYAHQMNFSRVLAILVFGNLPQTNRMGDWVRDVEMRSPVVKKKLLKIHAEIGRAIFWHTMAWSPVAWICMALALPIGLVAELLKVRISFVRQPHEISSVLEEDALVQRAADDGCLVGA